MKIEVPLRSSRPDAAVESEPLRTPSTFSAPLPSVDSKDLLRLRVALRKDPALAPFIDLVAKLAGSGSLAIDRAKPIIDSLDRLENDQLSALRRALQRALAPSLGKVLKNAPALIGKPSRDKIIDLLRSAVNQSVADAQRALGEVTLREIERPAAGLEHERRALEERFFELDDLRSLLLEKRTRRVTDDCGFRVAIGPCIGSVMLWKIRLSAIVESGKRDADTGSRTNQVHLGLFTLTPLYYLSLYADRKGLRPGGGVQMGITFLGYDPALGGARGGIGALAALEVMAAEKGELGINVTYPLGTGMNYQLYVEHPALVRTSKGILKVIEAIERKVSRPVADWLSATRPGQLVGAIWDQAKEFAGNVRAEHWISRGAADFRRSLEPGRLAAAADRTELTRLLRKLEKTPREETRLSERIEEKIAALSLSLSAHASGLAGALAILDQMEQRRVDPEIGELKAEFQRELEAVGASYRSIGDNGRVDHPFLKNLPALPLSAAA